MDKLNISKLNISKFLWQVFVARKDKAVLGQCCRHYHEYSQQVQRNDSSTLFSPFKATPAVQCPLLGSPIHDRHVDLGRNHIIYEERLGELET